MINNYTRVICLNISVVRGYSTRKVRFGAMWTRLVNVPVILKSVGKCKVNLLPQVIPSRTPNTMHLRAVISYELNYIKWKKLNLKGKMGKVKNNDKSAIRRSQMTRGLWMCLKVQQRWGGIMAFVCFPTACLYPSGCVLGWTYVFRSGSGAESALCYSLFCGSLLPLFMVRSELNTSTQQTLTFWRGDMETHASLRNNYWWRWLS